MGILKIIRRRKVDEESYIREDCDTLTKEIIWSTRDTLASIAQNLSDAKYSDENIEILIFVASILPNRLRLSYGNRISAINKTYEDKMIEKYGLSELSMLPVYKWIDFFMILQSTNDKEESIKRTIRNYKKEL